MVVKQEKGEEHVSKWQFCFGEKRLIMELTTNQGLKNQIKDIDDILELAAPFFCILCFILIKYFSVCMQNK